MASPRPQTFHVALVAAMISDYNTNHRDRKCIPHNNKLNFILNEIKTTTTTSQMTTVA
jgi:hypothetical protein